MFKVNIKKLGWSYWPRSGVFIVVNFEYSTHCSGVSIVGFEEVNARSGGGFLDIFDMGEMIKLQYVL